jgi:lyso-ornithine lipid O-acyltransferase
MRPRFPDIAPIVSLPLVCCSYKRHVHAIVPPPVQGYPVGMDDSPRRLRRLAAGPLLLQDGADNDARADVWPFGVDHHPHFIRRFRAIRRGITVLLWTILSMVVQAPLLALRGRGKVMFAQVYWAVFARLLGLRVRVIGTPISTPGRPVVYVSNHSSWLDIPVLGGRLDGCFVAKSEVSGWPVVSLIARMGRTVYVSRNRRATINERDSMRGRLAAGDNLILFPEGTTSDGSRVMPFRSTFFAIAQGENTPLIQPVSVVYDRLAGLPTGRASRPLFAWYGDMDIASHYWRLAQHRGLRATVLLHAPLDPATFPDRKALSRAVWDIVANGAATLRQNRPAHPLPLPAAADSSVEIPSAAYA